MYSLLHEFVAEERYEIDLVVDVGACARRFEGYTICTYMIYEITYKLYEHPSVEGSRRVSTCARSTTRGALIRLNQPAGPAVRLPAGAASPKPPRTRDIG
ncbi:hypothetical protein EVAR_82817_1 [Eumeta japonica]|uniref:Uncharacterized protein n=1 Tax=Eumeta variegata TaxID=151549 RepID=A0A4C1V364_EUMVA|nr:hypothetical protein EVAR_82817_1 [Eumeta japonica]